MAYGRDVMRVVLCVVCVARRVCCAVRGVLSMEVFKMARQKHFSERLFAVDFLMAHCISVSFAVQCLEDCAIVKRSLIAYRALHETAQKERGYGNL